MAYVIAEHIVRGLCMTVLDQYNNPEGTLTAIDELGPDNIDRYLAYFKKRSIPVVLRGYHRNDPALQTWSFQTLIERLPEQTVDLDVGDAMVSGGLTFEVKSLHHYLCQLASGDHDDGPVQYLQGFDIFAEDPTLHDEIHFPHLASVAVRHRRAGWIGPAGTVTGYHADLGDNQLSQVIGRKLVKMISPDQSKLVYRTRKYDPNGIACAVNADAWDAKAHPRFGESYALYTMLEPGDSVYIPAGWFHHVRSLDSSISVNQFGYSKRQVAFGKTADIARRYLHNKGLYGETCTCHMMVDGERVARR